LQPTNNNFVVRSPSLRETNLQIYTDLLLHNFTDYRIRISQIYVLMKWHFVSLEALISLKMCLKQMYC